MKIIFCNITYLNKYEGKISEEAIIGGGSWVKENKDAHEKWNFLNVNDYCYGFVQNSKEQFRIEQMDDVSSKDELADEVTVVWCARNKVGKTVIVGWYENATIYRYMQRLLTTPLSGIDRDFMCSTKAENAYLLPDEYRTFEIGRASETGQGTGFGQQNYWYAASEYAKENIIPNVMEFIESHHEYRINKLSTLFNEPNNMNEHLSDDELKKMASYYENNDYINALPLAYRCYAEKKDADSAYDVAFALKELYQYDRSLTWYKKVVELDGHAWDIDGTIMYMQSQCGQFEEAISSCKTLLEYPECDDEGIKLEIYGALADNNFHKGNTETAIQWLDKILGVSTDEGLREHTKLVKEDWSQYI